MEVNVRYRCSYCGSSVHYNRGPWTEEEDMRLITAVHFLGEAEWSYKPTAAGIQRCGMSCRNRWFYHIRPDIINDDEFFSEVEERRMIKLYGDYGNDWQTIADYMPGRTTKWIRHRCLAAIVRKMILLNRAGVSLGEDHNQERLLQQGSQGVPDLNLDLQPVPDLNLDLRLRPPSPPKN